MVERRDDKSSRAKLSMQLKAESGYECEEEHTIDDGQWGRIQRVLNGTEATPATQDGPLGGFATVGPDAAALDLMLTQFQIETEAAADEETPAEEQTFHAAMALDLKRKIIDHYTPSALSHGAAIIGDCQKCGHEDGGHYSTCSTVKNKGAPCGCYPEGNDGDCPAPGCSAPSSTATINEGLSQERVERIADAYFGSEPNREWCIAAINKALREDRKEVASRSAIAQPTLASALERIKKALKEADEERYQELGRCDKEAEHWKAGGDMYGWNLHMGRHAGCNEVMHCYYRVTREIEAIEKESGVTPDGNAKP